MLKTKNKTETDSAREFTDNHEQEEEEALGDAQIESESPSAQQKKYQKDQENQKDTDDKLVFSASEKVDGVKITPAEQSAAASQSLSVSPLRSAEASKKQSTDDHQDERF